MLWQPSEHSKLLELSEVIELPEVFSSMKKCLLHSALRLGDPLLELLELRFVSLSSETSRSFGTTQHFLMYVFFMHNNACSSYIPTTLYHNIQIIVKNAYFCVAKAKCNNPKGKFFLILLGTDQLEWLFGFIRAENGYNVNVSTYSLSNHISGVVECHGILSKHLDWD